MNLDGYATHIIQKLKLAVSIAIIQTKPNNLTIKEHIEELTTNFIDKMDEDFDVSVCSDDFDLDFSNEIENEQNNNTEDVNNSQSILENVHHCNKIEENMTNNNHNTNIVNQPSNKIHEKEEKLVDNHNNTTEKNNSDNYPKSSKDTIDCTNNNTEITIRNNDSKHESNIIDEVLKNDGQNTHDYYDIIFDNDNMIIMNDDRVEMNDSPTILEDLESLLQEKVVEDLAHRNIDIKTNKKNLSQDLFNASQNIDQNQCSNTTYCETLENTSLIHKNTQKNETQHINENNKNLDIISARNNNIKHVIDLDEDVANPKKKINLEIEPISLSIHKNIDPSAKFKLNVTKFLQNNNMVAKTTPDKGVIKIDAANKTPIEASVKTKNLRTKQEKYVEITEFTQNTSYSQSQPLFLIDHKYMYENRNPVGVTTNNTIKYTLQPENNKIRASNENIKEAMKEIDSNYNKNNIHFKLTNKQHTYTTCNDKKAEAIIPEDLNIENLVQEIIHEPQKTKKVISNDTDLNLQGEIYLFSQEITNNFENNNTNSENTQEFFNNYLKTNNLPRITERNTTNSTADETNEITNINKEHIDNIITHNRIETTDNSAIGLTENEPPIMIKTKHTLKNDEPSQKLILNETRIVDANRQENSTQKLSNLTQYDTTKIKNVNQQSPTHLNSIFSQNTQLARQNSNSSEIEPEELIPFKVIEELNKIKSYLNKTEAKSNDESSDAGYRSDSQSKSLKSTQPHTWLNQSAHSLFNHIATCPLIHTTQDITKEISIVLGQLIDNLHDNEQYPTFLEEMLEATDLMIKLIYEDSFEDNQLLKKDEHVQRIILLTKSTHLQKYTIEKITTTLEKLLDILTSKDSIQEIENIQKIENSCYLFHILYILLQKHLKKTVNSQKNFITSQKTGMLSQNSQYSSQYSSQNSQNSQSIKKSDISDIWRKKWNPNFKETSLESEVERKCVLSDCSKVLNSLIVNCMDGYSLIAYFSLKCFNLMQK